MNNYIRNDDSFYNILTKYKGDGPYLYIDGAKYIDAASGTFNLSLGYTHRKVTQKLSEQVSRCIHLSSTYTREIAETILEKMKERKCLPEGIERMWFRDVSGSGAVECAVRIAQKATGRSGVMSLFLSHHGQSLATAQISGNAFRLENFRAKIPGSLKIPNPPSVMASGEEKYVGEYSENLEKYPDIERIIELGSSNNISCLIIEPIMGNGGNIVIPQWFYRYIRNICDKYNIILIADEVQTGFGRTGSFFATTGYAADLKPDVIVFAKGAGAIGVPIGGVLMKKELDTLESFEHSSTCGANPLSLVAFNEIVDILYDENILDNVRENEGYLKEVLCRIQDKYDNVFDVRGIGYMFGFDVPSWDDAASLIKAAEKRGLIIRGGRYGKACTLKVRPPLICGKEHIDEIANKLDRALEDVFSMQEVI